MDKSVIRYAREEDISLILKFIKELAKYEKMLDEVIATEDLLRQELFVDNRAEVIFLMVDEKEVGFALFFHNFSTFMGRSGMYLEDLYVLPEYRGFGYGKELFRQVGKIAAERGCGRFEWSCLNWNQPSIDFYRSQGAQSMNEWTVYRIAGDTLKNMIEE